MATLIRRRNGPRPSPDAMTLTEHLAELRHRLIVSVACFVVAAVVSYFLWDPFLTLMRHPFCASLGVGDASPKCDLVYSGPIDGFAMRLNVAGYGGLVLASPVILYQLWRFVTPGLKANEKRYAVPFSIASVGLFLVGAFVAWLTFPHALGFLHQAAGSGLRPLWTPQKYLGLILALMAIFGLTFEFPIVLVALELAGALTPARLAKWRRVAFLIIVVVAAVITPSSDPFSMLAMAVPLVAFYELSIIIGRIARR